MYDKNNEINNIKSEVDMSIPNSKDFFENTIEDFDSIVVFSHVKPDGDAYGSSMGLKLALQGLYLEKKCYCVGSYDEPMPEDFEKPIKPGELSIDIIKNSLCIITDTGTKARIEDPRALEGKFVVKIDHHAPDDHFGDLEFVDDAKSSCSVIVADMLFASFPVIPANAASAILLGILSDTDGLKLALEADDFYKVGRLIYNGADFYKTYHSISSNSLKDIELNRAILNATKIEGKVIYTVFNKEQIKELGTTADELAGKVNQYGFADECPIWAMFVENENGTVRAEYRCELGYDVSEVAKMFNGGGHMQSSGGTLTSLALVDDVVKALMGIEKK